MSNFPHLQIQGSYLRSITVNDSFSGQTPLCYMNYQTRSVDKPELELLTECQRDTTVFILTKEHLPFLKQLVKDLEEVTK